MWNVLTQCGSCHYRVEFEDDGRYDTIHLCGKKNAEFVRDKLNQLEEAKKGLLPDKELVFRYIRLWTAKRKSYVGPVLEVYSAIESILEFGLTSKSSDSDIERSFR